MRLVIVIMIHFGVYTYQSQASVFEMFEFAHSMVVCMLFSTWSVFFLSANILFMVPVCFLRMVLLHLGCVESVIVRGIFCIKFEYIKTIIDTTVTSQKLQTF